MSDHNRNKTRFQHFALFCVESVLFDYLGKDFEGFEHILAAGEVDLAGLEVDVFEEHLHALYAIGLAGAEAQ